jgi:predicted nucleic acid-binding protein
LILVDSSVWIDFFADAPTPQVGALVDAIERGRVAVGDLMLTEVLQGCDTDRRFRDLARALSAFPVVEICDKEAAVEAARNYRRLRARGITVRKTIDTLIATRCILDDIPLLYGDRDFDPFVQHLGLRSAMGASGVN